MASTEAAAVEAPATVDTTGPTSFYGYKYDPNYEAPVEAITVDAVVAMAEHFEDLDKRADRFVTVINGHLAPADAGREGPES